MVLLTFPILFAFQFTFIVLAGNNKSLSLTENLIVLSSFGLALIE